MMPIYIFTYTHKNVDTCVCALDTHRQTHACIHNEWKGVDKLLTVVVIKTFGDRLKVFQEKIINFFWISIISTCNNKSVLLYNFKKLIKRKKKNGNAII